MRAINIKDLPGAGEIVIETVNGLKIDMNMSGIELSNGAAKIKLTTATVSINDGALEVL